MTVASHPFTERLKDCHLIFSLYSQQTAVDSNNISTLPSSFKALALNSSLSATAY